MLLEKKIPPEYIFNKIKKDLFNVSIIALVVYMATHYLGETLPEMPIAIPAFIGTAISVLLSFKLNQSYDRWWEARKIWGAIVNDSRSFIIQLQMFVTSENDAAIRKIAFRQIAWCYALGRALRGKNPVENLDDFISPEEISKITKHKNTALALLQMHGKDVAKLKEANQLDVFCLVQINNTLVRLSDAMGMAERIKSTVFPVTYRLFLHGIIYLFVITLSIALKDIESYFEIPLLLVISSAFFLLEKSATKMQDPFNNHPTDTAMTAIARTIEINIKQLLGEEDIPEPQQPEKFYLL